MNKLVVDIDFSKYEDLEPLLAIACIKKDYNFTFVRAKRNYWSERNPYKDNRHTKRWSKLEIDFLRENWFVRSIKYIEDVLGREPKTIKLKAYRLGFQSSSKAIDGITKGEICRMMGLTHNFNVKYNVKFKKKLILKKTIYYLPYDEFWRWIKRDCSILPVESIKKINIEILGYYPTWFKKYLKKVYANNNYAVKKGKWSSLEINKLKLYVKNGMCQKDIAKRLNRSLNSISNKIFYLNLNKKKASWTKEEEEKLKDLCLNHNYNLKEIAYKLNRTRNMINFKIRQLKLHENERYNVISLRRDWSEQELKLLKEYCKQGLNDSKIAKKLGRGISSVCSKRHKLKMKEVRK